MAATKASTTATKAESKPRKKPVRKSPAAKDYSSRLEWLKAMTEYEEKQAEGNTAAKIARLDKRIAAAKVARDEAVTKLTALITERDKLAGVPDEETAAGSDELTEDEHLALEGKA